jgi:hypothetical protein
MLNSMTKLMDLCYTVGEMAMFMPKADLLGVDIAKKWHDDPKSPGDGRGQGGGAADRIRPVPRQ